MGNLSFLGMQGQLQAPGKPWGAGGGHEHLPGQQSPLPAQQVLRADATPSALLPLLLTNLLAAAHSSESEETSPRYRLRDP